MDTTYIASSISFALHLTGFWCRTSILGTN